MLVAGIAGFRPQGATRNPSAALLHDWLELDSFTWLITEDILTEYKAVLRRLKVRHDLIGAIVNHLREEAEFVTCSPSVDLSPDPGDNAFCACAEQGRASFIVTLNQRDFPQKQLTAKVISPGEPLPTTSSRRPRPSRT